MHRYTVDENTLAIRKEMVILVLTDVCQFWPDFVLCPAVIISPEVIPYNIHVSTCTCIRVSTVVKSQRWI